MRLVVEHIDKAGTATSPMVDVSLLAFLKHASMAGQRSTPFFPSFARAIGLLLFYRAYLVISLPVRLDGFAMPDEHDPTELGHFSTIAGRAIADLLAKRLLFAKFTFTYEAAMRELGHSIAGVRPDFYCVSSQGAFALEAKARKASTGSEQLVSDAKAQAQGGPIPVAFAYASVTHDLYGSPASRFHDPVTPQTPLNQDLRRRLTNRYYGTLLRELGPNRRDGRVRIGQRDFLAFPFQTPWGSARFLLDREVTTDEGQRGEAIFSDESFEPDGLVYVDRDGVGIELRYRPD